MPRLRTALTFLLLAAASGRLTPQDQAGLTLDIAGLEATRPAPAALIVGAGPDTADRALELYRAGEFLPVDQTWLQNNGPRTEALWYAFRLDNSGTKAAGCGLEVLDSRLDQVDVWLSGSPAGQAPAASQSAGRAPGFATHYRSGLQVPLSQRPFKCSRFLFPATVNPGESLTVLVRIQSARCLKTQLLVRPALWPQETDKTAIIASSAIFGGILLLTFFSAFLSSLARRREYLFFVLACVLLLSYGILYTLATELPFVQDLPWLGLNGPIVLYSLGILGFVEFSRQHLAIASRHPLVNRLVLAGSWLLPAVLVFHAVDSQAVTLASLVLQTTILTLLLRAAWSGSPAGSREQPAGISIWLLAFASSIFLILDYLGFPGGGPAVNLLLYASRLCMGLACSLVTFQLFQEVQVLMRSKADLEEHDQISRAFLSGMSHEMRSPLNGIIGYTQNLDSSMGRDQLDHFRHRIEEEARVLLQKVDRILDVVRCESGKLELTLIRFSPSVMLRQLHSQWEQAASHKGLELVTTIDPALNTLVVADRQRLEQFLGLLLDNAVKFTTAGRIHLYGQANQVGPQHLQCTFAVEDTGPGISPERMRELFPRSRGHRGFARMNQQDYHAQMGIGLSLAQRLCSLLAGQFRVESTLDRGTVFSAVFSLPHGCKGQAQPQGPEHLPAGPALRSGCPLNQAAAAAPDTPGSIQSPGTGPADLPLFDHGSPRDGAAPPRILVVDDLPTNRQVIAIHLSRSGIRIDEAGDGAEALDLIRRHTYDLVLMDIYMPTMNGYEATRVIRKHWSASRLPVIGITASTEEDDLRECIASGMNCFLLKPLSREKLLSIMGTFIRISQ